jgi:hypothetical protein
MMRELMGTLMRFLLPGLARHLAIMAASLICFVAYTEEAILAFPKHAYEWYGILILDRPVKVYFEGKLVEELPLSGYLKWRWICRGMNSNGNYSHWHMYKHSRWLMQRGGL